MQIERNLQCVPTVIPGQGDMPAVAIYSFFDLSKNPQGVIIYSKVDPKKDFQNSLQPYEHLASALYKETLNIQGPEDVGLQKWIMAEKRFHEDFPGAIRHTLDQHVSLGWHTNHLPDIWAALKKNGEEVAILWQGFAMGIPACIWSARPKMDH